MSQEKVSTVTIKKPQLPKNAYRFFLQSCQEEQRKTRPDAKIKMIDFSQECSKVWKDLTPEKRLPFQQMAEKDKERYQQEMKEGNFAPPTRTRRGGKRTRGGKLKDPNAPKKFLTAFFWFCKEEREKVKEKFPDFRIQEISKELARMWAEVPQESKERFQQMSQNDKVRYQKEVEEYNKRLKAAANGGGGASESEEEEDEEGSVMESGESQ